MISAALVESTCQDIGSVDPVRAHALTESAAKAQPALFEFVTVMTEEMSQAAHGLARFIYHVGLEAFRRSSTRKLPRVKPGAIRRRWEENERALERLEKADPRFLERAAFEQTSIQPHVFAYVVQAMMETPETPEGRVDLTPEEEGALFMIFKTVIGVLHDAREKVEVSDREHS